jgi:SAM-dependent methyltransferase
MDQPGFDNRGDLACPRCGAALDGLRCTGCGAVFETVLGVPFLGDFEAADALGLIEIAANAPNRASLAVQPDWVEWFDALCAAYHVAPDREAFIAEHEAAQAFYFQHRYSEWRAVETLLEGQEIAGRDVLDVGAGPGFDAWRLALRGARVTAIDFSPILTEVGQGSLPGMRWFGGFSHALPFRDASFDFVFVNAALHHMRDVPVSIAEALRVLRPGGVLITSGDPFRSDAAGPSLEFDVFDKHEAVLLGINEQIPRASDFLTTLERNRDILDTEIFTQTLHGGRSGHGPDLTEWTRWDLDADAAMLKQRHGNFALRVRLKAPWPHPRHLQTDGILSPATFAGWLDDPAAAIAQLARIVPRDVVDTPFPGLPAKFDLLNGWRVAQSTATTRIGYRRARLFRTRGKATTLRYEIRSTVPAAFILRLNAREVGRVAAGPAWQPADFDVAAMPAGEAFVIEFQREEPPADFDTGCFEVREHGARASVRARVATQVAPLRRLAARAGRLARRVGGRLGILR